MAVKKKNITTFNEHLTDRYGKRGSKERTEFEIKAKAFLIGEVIKEERRLAKLTQEQLAEKLELKKVLFPESRTVKVIYSCLRFTGF